MKQILIYSDSLSWGIIPMTRRSLKFNQRWPGVMEGELQRLGKVVRIIENCLNGRRTIYEDAVKSGRNGLLGLALNSALYLVPLIGYTPVQFQHY